MDIRAVALQALADAGPTGLISLELGVLIDADQGVSTAVLSRLHRRGECARLAERRAGHAVYVHLDHLEGRQAVPYRPKTVTKVATDGFQRGYDMGLSAGIVEAANKSYWDGYNKGWNVGTQELARRLNECLDEMAKAIRGVHGIPPFPLNSRSWMTQPAHTIEVVRKFGQSSVARATARHADGIVDLTERMAR